MFATLFFGVLDPQNGKLIYINGGHETVFVIDRNGVKDELTPSGPAVGVIPNAEFRYEEINLQPGEILFAYTDGVIDARSPGQERFTRKRLVSLLSRPAASASDVIQKIGTRLFVHIGKAPQEDDITMLSIQRRKLTVL
jgi:sigma-B regulation protein RsbU (phosphoserine phosphatase)